MVSVNDTKKRRFDEIKQISRFFYETFYDALTFKQFRELINNASDSENKRKNKKVISYLRLYSHLNNAKHVWKTKTRSKPVHYLKIVRSFTDSCPFREEEPYYKKINELIRGIITEAKCKECNTYTCKHIVTSRVKIRIKLAENICMLRLLKVNEK